jgi:two-component system chemotaxis response regulator CheY
LKTRIFVVEDEKAFVDVYQKIFDIINFEIADWAYSGEEAVSMFRNMKERPALIIMDHRLPKMNGVETMIEILRIDPDAKLLFVSADERARKLAMDNGAIDFIQKPFSLAQFISTITKCAGVEPSKSA